MKIVYGKNLSDADNKSVSKIACECGIMFDTARLLLYRGIDTVEKAKRFLNPGKHGFFNPFMLKDMANAVERISTAKERGESVLVFGDYDADGVCATSVLYYCLKHYGINARIVVPEREVGYGVNIDLINEFSLETKVDLVITVDCGISDREKIKIIKDNGTDVIVTDHHEPPEDLPDCLCINPKIKGQDYPFDGLCGAGVAYKLGYALIGEKANEYLDFVALATVADSMDLVSENRDIVVEGLKLIQNEKTQRSAFKYLVGENNKKITAQTLAYVIAPRINAGGRMGDAMCALKIFTTQDENQIFDLAVQLNAYNTARQVECDNIYREAKERIILEGQTKESVILISNEKWQTGFIGIVAAKLVEDFSRPVIVFAGNDGHLKGSARSIDGVNIYEAILSCKELLIAFGGHSQAAGIAVSKENYPILKQKLNEYVKENQQEIDSEKKTFAEWEITSPINLRFAREIEMLEPFGVGNKRPVFAITVDSVLSLPLKAGSAHYSFKTNVLEMLDFNGERNVLPLLLPVKKKVLFEINLSTYKNRESLKGYSRQVVCELVDVDRLTPYVLANELSKIKNGEQEFEYVSKEVALEKIKQGATIAISSFNSVNSDLVEKSQTLGVFDCINENSKIILSTRSNNDISGDVIFLDLPLGRSVFGDSKSFVIEGADYADYVGALSTEREEFAKIFARLIDFTGKTYINSAQFAVDNFSSEEVLQAVFALEVFIELGIFKVENGQFSYDEKIKNALTNSKVYSKIYSIKG